MKHKTSNINIGFLLFISESENISPKIDDITPIKTNVIKPIFKLDAINTIEINITI